MPQPLASGHTYGNVRKSRGKTAWPLLYRTGIFVTQKMKTVVYVRTCTHRYTYIWIWICAIIPISTHRHTLMVHCTRMPFKEYNKKNPTNIFHSYVGVNVCVCGFFSLLLFSFIRFFSFSFFFSSACFLHSRLQWEKTLNGGGGGGVLNYAVTAALFACLTCLLAVSASDFIYKHITYEYIWVYISGIRVCVCMFWLLHLAHLCIWFTRFVSFFFLLLLFFTQCVRLASPRGFNEEVNDFLNVFFALSSSSFIRCCCCCIYIYIWTSIYKSR